MVEEPLFFPSFRRCGEEEDGVEGNKEELLPLPFFFFFPFLLWAEKGE